MLGIRLEEELDQKLAAIARQRGITKSALVREAIRRFLAENELVSESRCQSLLVAGRKEERETLEQIEQTVDLEGWK